MSNASFMVEDSLGKARWRLADASLADVEAMARRHDVPEIIARLLCTRGVSVEQAEAFLKPTLRRDLPAPHSLQGMEAMAQAMAAAIGDKKRFAIFGDFDVDGATSSALLFRFLKHCGVEARVYIPQRLTEGYGPNIEALRILRDEGAEVLFMLDCGTTAFDTIEAGRDMGLEIVIFDHHEAEERLPGAAYVINPKRKDDTSGLDMLAAVGVTFMCCVAMNAALRTQGFYDRAGTGEAPLKDWLDLVALGTVCDMVPLRGVNRLLVRAGFEQMRITRNEGLRALMSVAGLQQDDVGTYQAGFILGPRINAGSRVHQSDLGARLLCTEEAEEARNIAWTLNDCNDKRKDIQAQMEREAVAKVEAQGLDRDPVIVVGDEGWHAGLSGLVAGALKEKYARPACVMTFVETPDGRVEGRGSGRSVPGVHLAQAFIDARNAGLLEKGGGHAMAGGFTVMPDKIESFTAFLQDHVAGQAQSGQINIEQSVEGVLTVQGVRAGTVQMIHDQIGPFGQEFEEPLFVFSNVRVHMADIVGQNHIKLVVSDWEGGARLKVVAFRAVGTPMGDALLKQGRHAFHLMGHLKVNRWQGRETVELHVKDAALASASAASSDEGLSPSARLA